jgi:hypothetical protein
VHENIAAHDLAGALVAAEPELRADVEMGASALVLLEQRWADHLMAAWDAGRSSLL